MKQWLKYFFIMIILTLVYAFYYAYSSPYRISTERARDLLDKDQIDVILDVRTQVERDNLGFYPNSLHIPAAELETKFVPYYPNKSTTTILIYCNTGQRARKAAEKLQSLGYKNAAYIVSSYRNLM